MSGNVSFLFFFPFPFQRTAVERVFIGGGQSHGMTLNETDSRRNGFPSQGLARKN